MIEKILVISFLAAFIVLLSGKLGVLDWLQIRGNEFINKLANCTFCLSWWSCVIASITFALITGDIEYLLAAPLATPLTHFLI